MALLGPRLTSSSLVVLIGALLAVVGGFLDGGCERSLLYDPGFTHMFRKGTAPDAD